MLATFDSNLIMRAVADLISHIIQRNKWKQLPQSVKQGLAQELPNRHNRRELLASSRCGCYCCLRIFCTSEIINWCDGGATGEGETALCPYCGVDAVIAESSGLPLNIHSLETLNRIWFSKAH